MNCAMEEIPDGYQLLDRKSPFMEPIGPVYRKVDGTTLSLGLPIAETVARQHGGTLDVRPGSDGLTVRMRIPLCDPDQRPIA